MTEINARLTIGRTYTGGNEDYMSIEVEDELSSLTICKLTMSMHDFARALTGSSFTEVTAKIPDTDTRQCLGMKRETRRMTCPKVPMIKREELVDYVREQFAATGLATDGWELFSTGAQSRQDGDEHGYVICRWVMPDAEVKS